MTYNLKNRPNCKIKHLVRAKLVEQWFEGFEKQEMSAKEKADKKIEENRGNCAALYWQGYQDAKKEILGVES